MRIGIYYNNAFNLPGALVTQVAGTISTTGNVEFPTSAIALPAGTYWLMCNFQNTITRTQDAGSPATVRYVPYVYGAALPVGFPAGITTYTGNLTNAWVRGYP